MTVIPHSRPLLGDAERAAVIAAVETGWVGSGGPQSEALREELTHLLERPDCALVASGTLAIELGLRSLGVAGGRVAIPAYACGSIQRAVLRAGARPVLVDVENHDLAIGEEGLSSIQREVDAAVLVHQFGIISRTAREATRWSLPVVEDVTTVVGILPPGSPPLGSLAVMSMGATKPLCGGEGGAILGSADLVQRAAALAWAESDAPENACATQARMPDVCAALARAQLSALPALVTRRRAIAASLIETADELSLKVMQPDDPGETSWWRFLIQLGEESDAHEVVEAAQREGVMFSRPVSKPAWRSRGSFPVADRSWRSLVSVPVHAGLTDGEVERVKAVLRQVFSR